MAKLTSLRGRARIAHELGVSERTASRWRNKGLLEVKQLGGKTSGWRIERDAVDRLNLPNKERRR